MKYYTLKVLELRQETNEAVTVVFKQPGLKKLNYFAGQYLTLIFRINGRRYMRPYSFSSSPIVDSNLEVTVKRVPGGIVSNHIIDKLGVGDIVEVIEAMGNFTLNNQQINPDTHIVLWGAGSGITPLMSIAKYALYENTVKHVTIIYGNRRTESVIFKEKIQFLKEQYNERFSAWHFYTQSSVSVIDPYTVEGRIEPNRVLSVIRREDNLGSSVHYICGPVGLKESVKTALIDLGVSTANIFSEDFEIVKDLKEFNDIVTQTVLIERNFDNKKVEVVKGKSILEAGLDALMDLPYSCQTGTCMLCKARLTNGKIKVIGVDKLPDELMENDCLLCCSYPYTDDVQILIN